MAMEVVRSSIIAAALLFLTLVVLAATASGGDDAAAVVEEGEHPPPAADEEPYMLVAFHNKDGEEIRMLADKGTETLSAAGFANRSGHWFHAIRKQGKRRRRLPLPQLSNAEGLWNSIGALANTSDPVAAAADDEDDDEERYVLVGMQTSGGDKIRLVAVADQRYVAITGFAKGFSYCPNWFFREGKRHRLVVTAAALANGGGSSHAEVVASNLLRGLKTN